MDPQLLHYKIYGERTDNSYPVMLLHGLLGELENWQTQAKKLAQQYYVISVDIRNHGHSPHLKGMSYREMSEDIQYILNALNIPKVQLLGHSMGGKIAMHLALHNPQLIEKLIIVDIAPKAYPLWHQNILYGMLSLPLESFSSRKEIDQSFAALVPNAYERGFLLKNVQRTEVGSYKWKCDLQEIAKNYLKIAGFPAMDKNYKNEVFFIRGGRSDYLLEEDYLLINQYFPQNRVVSIENAGHLPHVEQVDAFFNVVDSYLKKG